MGPPSSFEGCENPSMHFAVNIVVANIGRIVRGEEPTMGQPVADDPGPRAACSTGDESDGEINSAQDGP